MVKSHVRPRSPRRGLLLLFPRGQRTSGGVREWVVGEGEVMVGLWCEGRVKKGGDGCWDVWSGKGGSGGGGYDVR